MRNVVNVLVNIPTSVWHVCTLPSCGKVTISKSLLLIFLPSPEHHLFKKLDLMVRNFLWNNKPPMLRKELIKVEISEGGLRHLSIEIFDAAREISCAKRLIRSQSKWSVLPKSWELGDIL